jgi:hypothetical protein
VGVEFACSKSERVANRKRKPSFGEGGHRREPRPHDAHPAFHPLYACWNTDQGESCTRVKGTPLDRHEDAICSQHGPSGRETAREAGRDDREDEEVRDERDPLVRSRRPLGDMHGARDREVEPSREGRAHAPRRDEPGNRGGKAQADIREAELAGQVDGGYDGLAAKLGGNVEERLTVRMAPSVGIAEALGYKSLGGLLGKPTEAGFYGYVGLRDRPAATTVSRADDDESQGHASSPQAIAAASLAL